MSAAVKEPLIRFQDVYRDAIQSLFGTNPSADEIIAAYKDAPFTGVDSIQVAGGTFYDLFAKKGRDEWAELEKITGFFRDKGVKLSALIRGDFLFTYEPQSYDVIRATVFEHAKLGINTLQNFHGMNDPDCLVGVSKAVKEAQAAGYDIVAQGTICIEDNPNITVDGCVEFARDLIAMGHEGIYLKSASGRLDPEFVYELTGRLYDEFPDQDITIHAHSTYGEAPICYMAAAKAATERGKKITMDVQNPALAGSTAHPSMLKMLSLIKNSTLDFMRGNAPKLNIDVIKRSMKSLFEMRFLYRDSESTYNPRLLEAMRKARVPGGASATLKSIPGLIENLSRELGTEDWDEIQIAIYEMQADILDDLGQPIQVTPYAANTTGQAALCLVSKLEHDRNLQAVIKKFADQNNIEVDSIDPQKAQEFFTHAGLIKPFDLYKRLYPGMVNYLVGRHGRVSNTVNPDLQKKALESQGLEEPVDYILSTDREPALPAAFDAIKAETENVSQMAPKEFWGTNKSAQKTIIEEPTIRQAISAVLLKDGVNHVIQCFKGENKPQAKPDLPFWAQVPSYDRYAADGTLIRDIRHVVQAVGGAAKIQEIAERALHLRQLDDELYFFSGAEKDLNQEWYEGNIAGLSELIDSIPTLLEQAGFTQSQSLNMSGELRADNIMSCIKYACNNKGVGLYEYMQKSIDEYKVQLSIDNSNENVVRFERKGRVDHSAGTMQRNRAERYALQY